MAAKYAPIVLCDEREPFDILVAGYTIFETPSDSSSFPRQVEWKSAGYPAARAIEYALWWDWDIQHLYELEHVWSFIDGQGNLVAAEASWHAYYVPIGAGETLHAEGTHPIVYAQPGKHAMVAAADGFELMREEAIEACTVKVGEDGLLDHTLFGASFGKTPEIDRKVKEWLAARAFTPSFRFSRRQEVHPEQLVPWETLQEWVPARVAWWVKRL